MSFLRICYLIYFSLAVNTTDTNTFSFCFGRIFPLRSESNGDRLYQPRTSSQRQRKRNNNTKQIQYHAIVILTICSSCAVSRFKLTWIESYKTRRRNEFHHHISSCELLFLLTCANSILIFIAFFDCFFSRYLINSKVSLKSNLILIFSRRLQQQNRLEEKWDHHSKMANVQVQARRWVETAKIRG